MLSFLRNYPYAFALVIALVTAALVWLYERTIEPDAEKTRKTFNKTLLAGVIAALAITWLAHKQEPLACEPFIQDA